jgi:hypothetical protein
MTGQSDLDVMLTAIANIEALRAGDLPALIGLHPVDMMDASCQVGAMAGLANSLVEALASAWGVEPAEVFAILRENVMTTWRI